MSQDRLNAQISTKRKIQKKMMATFAAQKSRK
jgi:hypothetical protein